MRLFQKLDHALHEIRRDLIKSPLVEGNRVQHLEGKFVTHEATNYAYSLPITEVTSFSAESLVTEANDNFDFQKPWSHRAQMVDWLNNECASRLEPLSQHSFEHSSLGHPFLAEMKEGNAYAYEYRERMVGMVDVVTRELLKNSQSRRAYWPIYQPLDATRMSQYTRIPCSIGYFFAIRDVFGVGPTLQMTYLQRSSDFEKFWLSDLWFAAQAVAKVYVNLPIENLRLGHLCHSILSFHYFINPSSEIY